MESLRNFKLSQHFRDVWIEIFKPDRSFLIEGDLIEGFIRDNLVLETDKLCLRYNWDYSDVIDVEVYGHGRTAWFRLNNKQFSAIKYYIQAIQ